MSSKLNVKKIIRGIFSAVLSVILSMSLVILGLLPSLHFLSSADGWKTVLEESGYAEKMKEDLLKQYGFLGETSGVPESVCRSFLEDCLSSELAYSAVLGMFSSESKNFDREEMTASFCRYVEEYAKDLRESGELVLTETEWEEMKADFPSLAKYYIDEMAYALNMSGVFSMMGSALRLLQKLISPILIASSVFAAVSFILLALIQRKNVLFYGYVSAVASGLLLTVPTIWLKTGNYVARLGIEPLYLKEMLAQLTSVMLEKLLFFGILFCAVGILLGVGATVLFLVQKKKKSEKKENDSQISEQNA